MNDIIGLNLLKRLTDDLDSILSYAGKVSDYPEEERLSIALLEEARVYLAANPATAGPSDEDLINVLEAHLFWEADLLASEIPVSTKKIMAGYARLCLARWGRSSAS